MVHLLSELMWHTVFLSLCMICSCCFYRQKYLSWSHRAGEGKSIRFGIITAVCYPAKHFLQTQFKSTAIHTITCNAPQRRAALSIRLQIHKSSRSSYRQPRMKWMLPVLSDSCMHFMEKWYLCLPVCGC